MKGIFLRKVTNSDIDLLYNWAIDPTVRMNSFNSNSISYEEHVKWFNSAINDKCIMIFILMDNDNPIGQIRLTIINDKAEIGYSIASEFRGRGYGHRILKLVEEYIAEHHREITGLVAKVKPDNDASNRLFQSERYKVKYLCYEKDIL